MSLYYMLDAEHNPVAVDRDTYSKYMRDTSNRVALDLIGDIMVSTVFLGLNHQFGAGPPLLFETIIFGGPKNGYQRRYSTWKEAEAGHAEAVGMVRATTE